MTNTIPMPRPTSQERNRLLSSAENFRIDALMRLYKRRAAVDELISSLENYRQSASHIPANLDDPISERKCS